ncbi:MAG: adenylosuccinate synthetase [Hadesarchaea archaeon]|nr:adenylosuccinate synthetase [Hadesarchaea archaeon]
MPCMIIAGGQWGDEGKGKIVAYLALADRPKIIARAGVGPNAGHTVNYGGRTFGLRQIPSGFVYEGARLLIGPGVLVNPEVVLKEVEMTGTANRFGVDKRCTIIEPAHIEQDRKSEYLQGKIGTTGTGCGPANVARVSRTAKLAEEVPELKPFLADVPAESNDAIDRGELVFVEGSQGFGLSLIHGTYPYVTSKDTSASTLAADVGIGPTKVDEVMLVFKAYTSRVGLGPFPTEISQEKAEELGIVEFGTVTGRRRRIGLFDFDLAKRAVMINGATQLTVTNLDRMFKGAAKVRRWNDLPSEARDYVNRIEAELGVPVTIISTGSEVEDIIDLRSEKL